MSLKVIMDTNQTAKREEALGRALQQIEKAYGKGAIMQLDKMNADVVGISTTALSLDLALGGQGLPRGRVVELYGPEASGKTTLALHVAAAAQKAGGVAAIGDMPVAQVPVYLAGQFTGALLGAVLVWLAYLPLWEPTEDQSAKLSVFCTVPAIRHTSGNLICEIIGTAMLLIGVLGISNANNGIGSGLGPYLVGILVFSIGLSLSGPTGYAINPARDLAPRIAHALLPIPGKRDSDWGYAWVPIVGPLIGCLIGALLYKFLLSGLTPLAG